MMSNCPDKLISTAFAIADYVHGRCTVGKCIKVEGATCNDYGWAFPEQKRDLPPINNKNESTTSKAIKALVEQGWLIKVAEKKNRKEEKNFFALAVGTPWDVKVNDGTRLLDENGNRQGGRRKAIKGAEESKAIEAVVHSNNDRLFNSTTTDCSTQQPPVVHPNKVNINSNVNGNSNLKVNSIKGNPKEVKENEDNTGAKAPQQSLSNTEDNPLISNEGYPLISNKDSSLDDESDDLLVVESNNQSEEPFSKTIETPVYVSKRSTELQRALERKAEYAKNNPKVEVKPVDNGFDW